MRKIILVTLSVVTLVGLLVWAYIASSQPLPGVAEFQPGRDHHPQDTKLTYNFNPPTSGDHYPEWITKGIYDVPRPDGNLVHSMEHGYVIIWYNCNVQPTGWQLVPQVLAQSPSSLPMQQGGEGSPSGTLQDLPETFRSAQCEDLKKQLKDEYAKVGSHKMIVIPRPNMDKRIVVTAWGKKLELGKVDQDQIGKFVDAYRDHGPEQTDEP